MKPIHVAAHIGDLPCVKVLVESGADAFDDWVTFASSVRHLRSTTAPQIAIMHGNDDVMEFLIGLAPTDEVCFG